MDFTSFTYNIIALKRLAADMLCASGCTDVVEYDISSFSKKAELTTAYPKRVPTDAAAAEVLNARIEAESSPFARAVFEDGHINISMADAFYECLIDFVNRSSPLPAYPETTRCPVNYALIRMLMLTGRCERGIPHTDAMYYRVLWALFVVTGDPNISKGRKKALLKSACNALGCVNSTTNTVGNEFAACAARLIQAAINQTEVDQ